MKIDKRFLVLALPLLVAGVFINSNNNQQSLVQPTKSTTSIDGATTEVAPLADVPTDTTVPATTPTTTPTTAPSTTPTANPTPVPTPQCTTDEQAQMDSYKLGLNQLYTYRQTYGYPSTVKANEERILKENIADYVAKGCIN